MSGDQLSNSEKDWGEMFSNGKKPFKELELEKFNKLSAKCPDKRTTFIHNKCGTASRTYCCRNDQHCTIYNCSEWYWRNKR